MIWIQRMDEENSVDPDQLASQKPAERDLQFSTKGIGFEKSCAWCAY